MTSGAFVDNICNRLNSFLVDLKDCLHLRNLKISFNNEKNVVLLECHTENSCCHHYFHRSKTCGIKAYYSTCFSSMEVMMRTPVLWSFLTKNFRYRPSYLNFHLPSNILQSEIHFKTFPVTHLEKNCPSHVNYKIIFNMQLFWRISASQDLHPLYVPNQK